MNYLAHILLASHSDHAMVGAFLGDFLRPSDAAHLPHELQRELWLHRYVDSYTDAHPEVRAARQCCQPKLRLLARVALDVYFDHLLSRHWTQFSDQPIGELADRFYAAMDDLSAQLPTEIRLTAKRMRRYDWLRSYVHYSAVEQSVQSIGRRLSRGADRLQAALAELHAAEDEVQARFLRFFPQLQAFAEQRRAEMQLASE